jgi:hypothetical protein
VNFEFPKTSENEKFAVAVDGKTIPFIQSMDEEGNWHVAFDVLGSTQNKIVISGFEKPDSITATKSESAVESREPVAESQGTQVESQEGIDYSVLYYVIPAIIAAGIGVIVFSLRKAKPAV